MKKVLLSVTAAAALSSFAMAGGDIVPAPAPMDSWSGFYMGLQAGYSWGDADFDVNYLGEHYAHAGLDVDGMAAGFYAGYNWLLSDGWLVGLEGEWNYLGASDTAHPTFEGDNEPDEYTTIKVTQDWEASARLRVGKVMGDYLPYITGGVAWTSVNTKAIYDSYTYMDDDQVLVGWTVGVGVEMAISENVHARLQYRYTDYGDENFDGLYDYTNEDITHKVDFNSHMLTVGLSYRF